MTQGTTGDDPFRIVRWTDFRRRADYAPQKVYRHRTREWEYIPIHAFADEPELLASLGLSPADCRSADAWWGIDGDATLLESMIAALSPRPPGLYAKATPREALGVYLVAVLDAPCVTRAAFEDAMTRFADAGFPNDPRFRLEGGDPWFALR